MQLISKNKHIKNTNARRCRKFALLFSLAILALAFLFPVTRSIFWGFTGNIFYKFTEEAAARSAGESGDFGMLKIYLSNPDDRVRFFAISGLKKLATNDAEMCLRGWLPHESNEYNQVAIICAILQITNINDDDVLKQFLNRSMHSPSVNVRRYSRECLEAVR